MNRHLIPTLLFSALIVGLGTALASAQSPAPCDNPPIVAYYAVPASQPFAGSNYAASSANYFPPAAASYYAPTYSSFYSPSYTTPRYYNPGPYYYTPGYPYTRSYYGYYYTPGYYRY